jgi:biotin carboxylase
MEAKSVIIIGGGIQQVEAVRIAQSMGLKVIVTDRNPESPCFPNADYTAIIDGRDIEGLIAFTLLNKEKLNICGVLTLTELVTSVAAVALAADLPGVPLQGAVACQNKILCKKIWQKNNITTPVGDVIRSFKEADKMFDALGGKIFVKPLVGFGGKGAKKYLTRSDFEKTFTGMDDISFPLIMEEFIDGTMHDVNAVFDLQGNFHPLGCFDRSFHPDHPVELGACYPSQLAENKLAEIYSLTKKAAKALGIAKGPVKADLVLTDNGFSILEMAPRLHGPKGTLWLTSFAGGSNHLKSALRVITGEEFITNQQQTNKYVSIYRALLPEPGRLQTIIGIEKALKVNGIEMILVLLEPGTVINEYTNSTSVPAYMFATGKNLQDANHCLDNGQKLLTY